MIGAPVEKLKNKSNYQLWLFHATIQLKSHAAWEVAKGTLRMPTGDAKEKEITEWKKRDGIAQRVIAASLDPTLVVHVMRCKSAKEMWKTINDLFEKKEEENKCEILEEFFSMKYEKSVSIMNHVGKLEAVYVRLKAMDDTITEYVLISKILATLPDKLNYFKTAWESTAKAERTLENLKNRLFAEEERCSTKSDVGVAFQASNKQVICHNCENKGHYAKDCKKAKKKMWCSRCRMSNHTNQMCFKKDKKHDNTRRDGFNGNKVSMYALHAEQNKGNEWIVDSGTTAHLTVEKTLLKDSKQDNTEISVAKAGSAIKAERSGTIEFEKCELTEVLYVPELRKNLLSVNAICEKGGKVTFSKNEVSVTKDGREIVRGTQKGNGLFAINFSENPEVYLADKTCWNWHEKLGHLGAKNVLRLANMSEGIKLTPDEINQLNTDCVACIKGKQVRLPFPGKRQRASRVLELIHADLSGKISHPTWDNYIYFALLEDDFSGHFHIYLLKHKSDFFDALKKYVLSAEIKHNCRVAKLRCDNAGENSSSEVKEWCENRGIELEYSPPYTPSLNGKIERGMRTVVEKARTILLSAKMNMEMWGEALYCAVHLTNRSPRYDSDKTPYEIWNKRKPNLKYLQVFGCEAWVKTLTHVKKFEERSKLYTFVGYAPMAYRLWDPKKRVIIVSREVKFRNNYVENNLIKQSDTDSIQWLDIDNESENESIEEHNQEENEVNGELEDDNFDADVSYNEDTLILDASESEYFPSAGEEEQSDVNSTVIDLEPGERRYPDRVRAAPDRLEPAALLTYHEAVTGPEADDWWEAINEEKSSLEENGTWTLVPKEEANEKRVLGNTWVLTIKSNGRKKARLVIRGDQQVKGEDYQETYSPVVSNNTIRIILALASDCKANFMTFDVKTAFLYGTLDEDIYMRLPLGYKKTDLICKLNKALYGLKQASRQWNKKFVDVLITLGFNQVICERCVFVNVKYGIILAIHVDDGLMIYYDALKARKIIKSLEEEFKITANFEPNSFLGIEIVKTNEMLTISQNNYARQILEKFNMQHSKPMSTPAVKHKRSEDLCHETVNFPYRHAVGNLMYLACKTRPDLTFSVNMVSRFMEKPTNFDVVSLKRIFRYLNGETEASIKYKSGLNNDLVAFCDADYADDENDRKSTGGYVIMFKGGPIAWGTCKQKVTVTSTTEAEFVSACTCVKTLIFLKSFIENVTGEKVKAKVFEDNQGAIDLIKNGIFNKRSKHIEVRYHYICEMYKKGRIEIEYVPTDEQLADIFTKPLTAVKFHKFKEQFFK